MDINEYLKILAQHGRRIANRVALAHLNEENGKKELRDFYSCYGDESSLPENEKCKTGLISKFDPTGWHDHYVNSIVRLWPEPHDAGPIAE
jgi:hypothetical protein